MKYFICSYGNGIAVGLRAPSEEAMEEERNCLHNFAGVNAKNYLFDGVALFPSTARFYRYLVERERHAQFANGKRGKDAWHTARGLARLVWERCVSRKSFMHDFAVSRHAYSRGQVAAEKPERGDS